VVRPSRTHSSRSCRRRRHRFKKSFAVIGSETTGYLATNTYIQQIIFNKENELCADLMGCRKILWTKRFR
jgi:hypothetical protein